MTVLVNRRSLNRWLLEVGLELKGISGEVLPTDVNQLYLFQCLWERECVLSNSAILLNCDWNENNENNKEKEQTISRFIEALNCPLIITTKERRPSRQRPLITFDVHTPSRKEQHLIWEYYLGETYKGLNGQVEGLVSQFNLSPSGIQSACVKINSLETHFQKITKDQEENATLIHQQLWEICRQQSRPRLEELAQRIEASADWDDLIYRKRKSRF
jgi:hypothetical protein